ncbi:cytochrome c biogenesis CcdA family protein [Micromonospora sp. WMMA1923]|uniref:cytochrome c biogenesis CcdA family protein n=1 Tax=Micromonospora sp. WMMA1923 TaxID=3404125 RepID=UPI003B964FCA
MSAPLLLALTAGMLGAVNPCGFAMLPAYLSVLVVDPPPERAASPDRAGVAGRGLRSGRGPSGGRGGAGGGRGGSKGCGRLGGRGSRDEVGRRGAVRRALTAGAALTIGYVLVFGAFGLALAPLTGWLRPRLPWVTLLLGLLLVALGCWLLAGRRLPGPPRFTRAPRLSRTWPAMTLFGMAYALTSLTCAIAPFLAIVATSFQARSTLRGLALFGAYAIGMGLVVTVTALGVALLRGHLVARLRGAGAVVPRLGGAVLLAAGGYVAWYGWYELRLAAGRRDAVHDPVVTAAGRVQQQLVAALDTAGPVTLGVLLVLLLALAAGPGWRARPATAAGAPVPAGGPARPDDGWPGGGRADGARPDGGRAGGEGAVSGG